MNDKIISFRLLPPITLSENYIEGGEKYLLFYLLTETDNAQRKGEKTEEHVFLLGRSFPYLIIPDDNSPIVSQIKNRKEKEYFTISLTNLQFKPNFLDGNEGKGPQPFYCDGLLVKDTNQIKKAVANTPSFPEITFKVVGQRKTGHVIGTTYEESFSKYGSYSHILEIEPLDLGIEGLPPIVRIFFDFANSLQPIFFRPLTESRFYNSNILTDSVGKTFVMKVKSWGFGEKRNNFGNDTLNFGGDNSFDWDSFQEKTVEDNKQPNLDQPQNPKPKPEINNNKPANQTPEGSNTLKTILIISGIIGSLILVGFLFYFCKKKSSPKK